MRSALLLFTAVSCLACGPGSDPGTGQGDELAGDPHGADAGAGDSVAGDERSGDDLSGDHNQAPGAGDSDGPNGDVGGPPGADYDTPAGGDDDAPGDPNAPAGDATPRGDTAPRLAGDEAIASGPLDSLTDVTLYLNLGDSVAAGYNASGENSTGGMGYARLLFDNHPSYPTFANETISARFPGASMVDRAHSGETSAGVVEQTNSLPGTNGDVVVTIYTGGNDLNDDMLAAVIGIDAIIDNWVANVTEVLARLRAAYQGAGRSIVIALATVHDPTDGTMQVPAGFDNGFCGPLHQLAWFGPLVQQMLLDNLAAFNDRVRQLADDEGLLLMDSHALFLGHGMNSPDAERWITDDCAHFSNEGHHQARREFWRLLTDDAP